MQSTVKQSSAYCRLKYELPEFLQGKPHNIQCICLMNIQRGKGISKSHLSPQGLLGSFTVTKSVLGDSSEENVWTVSIPKGTCTCLIKHTL